jgi:predicted O-methyltransferase YrrM
MLATPVTEKPNCNYVNSLAGTVETLVRADVRLHHRILQGCCHVDDARNYLIRDFLQSECTDLLFLDADMGWLPNNVLRVLKAPGDIVAGVYCHKSDQETYPFHPFVGRTTTANEHGLFEMPKAATGFMRIRRHVIEALYEREKAKGRLIWLDGDNENQNRLPVARICERGFVRELGLEGLSANEASQSGDYVLCLKARQLGFQVFIDPEMGFSHAGEKVWTGHFGNHLRRNQKIDHPKFEQAMEAIVAGNVSVEVLDKLNAHSMYDPRAALPGVGLEACWRMAKEAQGDLLECGSGLSTIIMGLALKGTAHRLYSLEADLEWTRRTNTWLQRYGVGNVELIYVPLVPVGDLVWYGIDPEMLPQRFDGVLIDGPARTGTNRNAVFEVLGKQIASARTWIIDDMEDPVQIEMLKANGAGRSIREFTGSSAGWRHDVVVATLERQAVREAAE